MRSPHAPVVLGLVTLALAFVACSGGGSTGTSSAAGGGSAASSGTTTSGATTGGDATTSGTTGAGGATATSSASSSASSTGTGGPILGYCTRPCGTVTDCCPVGSIGCPSNTYPNNYTCDKSACKQPECATKADCAALDPKQDCFALSGYHSCADACSGDGDCTAPATCSGADDSGKKYCLSTGGGGCTDDASCGGFGKCVNKVCACEKAADCTKTGFTACAL